LAFGGLNPGYYVTNATEEYDGSTWTPGGNLNTARIFSRQLWITNSRFSFGGKHSINCNNKAYNGSTWTWRNFKYSKTFILAGAGIQTAGLGFGGKTTCFDKHRRI
jgi:hypothetical protein